MNVADLFQKEDCIKKTFKYYKSNNPKPSLQEVISVEDCNFDKVINVTSRISEDRRATLLGLEDLSQWKLYTFQNHPGLLLLKNPFTAAGQRYWVRKCLEEYPRKPNKTNIDTELLLQDWWEECYYGGLFNRILQKKLRWTTLGYHHNWDTKEYSDDNRTTFPEDLKELTDVVACYLGYSNFKAEAAIINYYHMDSTLSPHTDHSEANLDAPLFSFSFGQSAIFLIGGKDKTVQPSALLINSGDIVIMSDEARLCYHAIPKILPATYKPWEYNCNDKLSSCNLLNFKYISNHNEFISLMNMNDNVEWNRFRAYVEESRINMNVRQVLNQNQGSLTDVNFNIM